MSRDPVKIGGGFLVVVIANIFPLPLAVAQETSLSLLCRQVRGGSVQ